MNIPTVTEEDLRAFHAQHFPGAPTPVAFFPDVDGSYQAESYEDEDDGLGYYPDGVKRTLTDDQIAMFRHSEIQTILREKRLRQENESPPPVEAPATEPVAQNIATASMASPADSLSRADSTTPGPDQHKKRKRKSRDSGRPTQDASQPNIEERTHRRIARELDEQKNVAYELDY